MGALKLGLGAGIGYTIGGNLGASVMATIKKDASREAIVGATWAGRITVTLVTWALLGKL